MLVKVRSCICNCLGSSDAHFRWFAVFGGALGVGDSSLCGIMRRNFPSAKISSQDSCNSGARGILATASVKAKI